MPQNWIYKYEPKTLDDMILEPTTRDKLTSIYDGEYNSILYSKPGMGKNTFINIFLKNGYDDIFRVNASKNNGINFIRDQVETFAYRGRGLSKKIKICVFNEADKLTPESQSALKEIIEISNHLCVFFFITNRIDPILDAIISRCPVIEFKKPIEADIIRYVEYILTAENVVFDDKVLRGYVSKFQGDIRGIVNGVEMNSYGKKLGRVQ